MTNIRVVRLKVVSTTSIKISFTATPESNIGTGNFQIASLYGSVPDPTVTSVSVSEKTVTLATRPMVFRAYYRLTIQSTSLQPFRGARGETFIEDGSTNQVYFVGPSDENEMRDTILGDLPDIYKVESGSLIFDAVDTGAREMLKAAHRSNEVLSASYVSVEVTDEKLTRSSGPYDRLGHEGAYQILRVGLLPTGATDDETFTFSSFPSDPLSLQQTYAEEESVLFNSGSGPGFYQLTISLARSPVIIVAGITLKRGSTTYEYDIEAYRYGILDSKYDSANSYDYLVLADNQIMLNSSAIGPAFPLPDNGDELIVSYYYKNLGRIVGHQTLEISHIVEVVRESAPAVSTSFFLRQSPIVDEDGNVQVLNGVEWLDPAQNYDSTRKHPAFITEISYSTSVFPKRVGEYSINYETGQVFVFGASGTGTDGTTPVPPVANYLAKVTYVDGLDYIFDEDENEIASLPERDLRGSQATVHFEYEDTFAESTDFSFESHIEVTDERVENRLISTVGLKTLHGPVTEVFRIYNETTGEIYVPGRINDNEVYFTANRPPATVDVVRETVQLEPVLQSSAAVASTMTVGSLTVFKVELEDTDITSETGWFLGSSFNTSLVFSNTDTFAREMYYDPDATEAVNLARLLAVGDYMVNYELGTAYVAVLAGADTDVGDATYRRAKVLARNRHILWITDLYRSAALNQDNTETFQVEASDIADETINVNLSQNGETEVDDEAITIQDDGTVVVGSDVFRLYGIYQVTDLKTTYSPINFSSGATVSSSTPTTIALSSSGVSVTDDNSGTGLLIQQAGSREYVEAERLSALFAAGLAELVSASSVKNIYTGSDYWLQGSDGYVDAVANRIYLPSGVSALGSSVEAVYSVALRSGAAVLVSYTTGNMYVDYTYCADEILLTYEYGDNNLDWSISDSIGGGKEYYATYRYGALRNSLRDNFGVLTGLEELSEVPESVDRETYRHAIAGTLQTFPTGPTIPSIKALVSALTKIDPNITESVFLEWILGRDYLNLSQIVLAKNGTLSNLPGYSPAKFGDGLLLNTAGQTATIPAVSNIRFAEGTWEAFVVPAWDGIDNDAELTFDIKFDGVYRPDMVFVGSDNANPSAIPFSLKRTDIEAFGRPNALHNDVGYFIWYDTAQDRWRLRVRAPVVESRRFTGMITSSGEFNDVRVASTADGYEGYDGYNITEQNDYLWSTDTRVRFSFIVDAYDSLNMAYDAFDAYGVGSAGFDGIDFSSDNIHYLFDTGEEASRSRMSLYKDGRGFLRFRVYDDSKRMRMLSAYVGDWQHSETHHVAVSWKIGTVEMHDELHLFVDGAEVPNTYRYRGYLTVPVGTYDKFMDQTTETLVSGVTSPTILGYDLVTTAGSNSVSSATASLITSGVQVDDRFVILEETTDGDSTRTYPYVYVRSITSESTLTLKTGLGADFNLSATLSSVRYSVNQLELHTVADTAVERLRVFAVDSLGDETELYSPGTLTPEYEFYQDGYQDYVRVWGGVPVGGSVILRSYGLMMARCRHYVYMWSDSTTNLLNSVTPPPTSVSKIDITKVIVKAEVITSNPQDLVYSQPSNSSTGKRLTAVLLGDSNIDFLATNKVAFTGTTPDGYAHEELSFTEPGELTTSGYFTTLTDVIASLTFVDAYKSASAVEVRETVPINWQENSGTYAEVHLSVQDQNGVDGYAQSGTAIVLDAYARFGVEDIGKRLNILSPLAIAGTYTISNVPYDSSGLVRDSNSVVLSGVTWGASYTDIVWRVLNTSYGDSGFANGLITLETVGSGGQPFLLGSGWYEVDMPTYLVMSWGGVPQRLFIGSDMLAGNQASAAIDEMRILDEVSTDTGRGETVSSSGRSITTDAQAVREFSVTTQTLALFHFNSSLDNSAKFYSNFSGSYRQSENSVNSDFGQSAVFNLKSAYQLENKAIFQNNGGTIEFWVSPILDTHNDPTRRYYVDLSSEQQVPVEATTSLVVLLPFRVRSVSSVVLDVAGTASQTNYYTGGSLASDGRTVTLGQPLPSGRNVVMVTFIPLAGYGDRFSIYKSETGSLVLLVTASGTDFQISVPVYWKKNTWHRVFAGWDLNNAGNQDRLVLMVDGTEGGTVRYGTGLRYGTGVLYGQPTIWGSARAGTTAARNILADINLRELFSIVNIGADFTGQYPAMARMDNIRFSNILRPITYVGEVDGVMVGTGPGRLIGKDLLYASNPLTAQPMIEDSYTTLLLDFDTNQTEVQYLSVVRNAASGIFDFYVEVIDTFSLVDTTAAHQLIESLIDRLKPAHTRAFVSFIK